MIIPDSIYYVDPDGNKIYYTIIDNKIFYNCHDTFQTFVQEGKTKHLLFENSCMTHNFSPFMFKNRFYAIGGQDNWKVDHKWRGINYIQFKEMWEEHFQKIYKRGPEFYEVIKYKFDTTPVYSENRGLYLSDSADGIEWNLVKKYPIINVDHPGFISSLAWKSAEFDAKPSLMRYKSKWFLYMRANIDKDKRHIQVTTSKDLLNWSKFHLIDIDYNQDVDNYYDPVIIEHKRKLVGFFNYYNNDTSCIKVKTSSNGIDWLDVKEIFLEKPFILEHEKRKIRSHICSIDRREDLTCLYINHNYNNNDNNFCNYITKYKIKNEDLNEYVNYGIIDEL